MRTLLPALALAAAASLHAQTRPAPKDTTPIKHPGIEDNSFLVEEAFNQGEGVVQQVQTFQRPTTGGSWGYSWTSEWPVPKQRHQLSSTVVLMRADGAGEPTRLGDGLINYRLQWIDDDAKGLLVAPRLTLVLPTGSAANGTGADAMGYQWMIPVTKQLRPKLITHWDVGHTITPGARNAAGRRATTHAWVLANSAIWQITPVFNLMVEHIWSRGEQVTGADRTSPFTQHWIAPGVRWAHDFRSGLQIVPGLAVPIGVGPTKGQRQLFLYWSTEYDVRDVHR
ncbi:MAG: hypothetical protein K2X99_00875 [Gemmatimonadaceae bacterium]|nr:hypothetical protein [Gemmatimonadaceae bacterium]